MLKAFELARQAAAHDEVPVGAIITKNDKIIASAYNLKEANSNATAHAEIIAIQDACKSLNSWRLNGCELYVTLEPCLMCAGAIIQARLQTVVFGASDPKGGAFGSLYKLHEDKRLNHQVEVISGVEEPKCKQILKDFFLTKRQKKTTNQKP